MDIRRWLHSARVEQVSAAEAQRRQSGGAIIVDVREADEWAAGHVAGARHIPLARLGQRLRELSAEAEILFICHSGSRSAVATSQAAQAGYRLARNVEGGMLAWERAGLPIQRSSVH